MNRVKLRLRCGALDCAIAKKSSFEVLSVILCLPMAPFAIQAAFSDPCIAGLTKCIIEP